MSDSVEGGLLVGEVVDIEEFGAVLRSAEYDGEIFLHVSEVPLRREEKLTDRLRKGAMIVVRPVKEDRAAKRLFVSLKGISRSETKSGLRAMKEERSARTILRQALQECEMPLTTAAEIESHAIEKFGSLSRAFRSILEAGDKALSKLRLPSQLSTALKRQLEAELMKKAYTEKRTIEMYFTSSDGASKLRTIGKRYTEGKEGQLTATIRTISPPKYELVVQGKRPKAVKAAADEIVEKVLAEAKKLGGSVRA